MELVKLILRLFRVRSIKLMIHFLLNYMRYGNYWPVYFRILDGFKVVYIENPKVACTSVKSVLKQHGELRSVFKLVNVGDYYLFTVVRNPFTRLVSCYKNKIIRGEWLYGRYLFGSLIYGLRKDISFENFVDKILVIPDSSADIHFRSQSSIIDKTSSFVDVLRFENIENDFDHIRVKFNLAKLPKKNKSVSQEWLDFYTPELATKVYERFKTDFTRWYPNAYEDLMHKLEE